MQIILINNSLDIFNHLATEEYLLKQYTSEFLMIWRSSPAVVIGKHQNLFAETNFPYIHQKKINLARRISGGGTVYHDEGNINFTFIKNGEEGNLIDFKEQTKPIIHFLNDLDIDAYLGKRNNIFINDKKISGNAEHVYKKRILHHGTLLYSSNLPEIYETLRTKEHKYSDKAVKSVKAHITNIVDHLYSPLHIEEFIGELVSYFQHTGVAIEYFTLKPEDKEAIEKLKQSKYLTEDWVYGYSPKYRFSNSIAWGKDHLQVQLNIEKGIITSVICDHIALVKVLTGKPHRFEDVKKAFQTVYPKTGDHRLNNVVYSFFY